jgi:ABC-2 type transport system permease protein
MRSLSFSAIASVARKEFLHVYRDRRVLILLLVLPPLFTLMFGHAFEVGEMTDTPALLINGDDTPRTQRFVDRAMANKTFKWRRQAPGTTPETDLLGQGVRAALVVPPGWSEGLANGKPIPLRLYLDASDTNIAPQLLGSVQQTMGEFQLGERQEIIDALPDEVFDLAEKLPLDVRQQFVSAMEPWTVDEKMLYNPKERFIDYVLPASSA